MLAIASNNYQAHAPQYIQVCGRSFNLRRFRRISYELSFCVKCYIYYGNFNRLRYCFLNNADIDILVIIKNQRNHKYILHRWLKHYDPELFQLQIMTMMHNYVPQKHALWYRLAPYLRTLTQSAELGEAS